MKKGVFITGTDTGIGKTFVTALLLAELRRRGVHAVAFKPIACGASGRADAKLYAELMDGELSLEEINPIWLRKPLAPWVAARLEKRRLNLDRVHRQFRDLCSRFPFVLVEGVGGWLVPIKQNYFVRELATDFKLPLIVVGRPRLGTLNHTLLTVESARAARLPVRVIVLNDSVGGKSGLPERTNGRAIQELTGIPVVVSHFYGNKATSSLGIRKMLQQQRVRGIVNNILRHL